MDREFMLEMKERGLERKKILANQWYERALKAIDEEVADKIGDMAIELHTKGYSLDSDVIRIKANSIEEYGKEEKEYLELEYIEKLRVIEKELSNLKEGNKNEIFM